MEALMVAVERAPATVAPGVPPGVRGSSGGRQQGPREYRAATHGVFDGTRTPRSIQLATPRCALLGVLSTLGVCV
jgi:hypothetical protein